MKARPILFSGPMVRALLDGRKTQTRRIVKGDPVEVVQFVNQDDTPKHEYFGFCATHRNVINRHVTCPYGQPGDLLWCRETFSNSPDGPIYRATEHEHGICGPDDYHKWKPSIHMPRWASRLTLQITDIRVERLQDISEQDAIAEGIDKYDCGPIEGMYVYYGAREPIPAEDAIESFQSLWTSINGPDSWAANPWVWALTFTVHRCNVDDFLRERAA